MNFCVCSSALNITLFNLTLYIRGLHPLSSLSKCYASLTQTGSVPPLDERVAKYG